MPVYGFRVSCLVFRGSSGTGNKGGTDAGEVARIDSLERNKLAPHALSTPYALDPRPETLNPKPCTLHPTPYTLHPIPYTNRSVPHPP